MSAIVVFTPLIVAGWPAITAACAGAAAALGMAVAQGAADSAEEAQTAVANTVEVAVDNAEVVAENMATGQQIVMTQGEVKVRVFRDERGRCRVCVEGPGRSNEELETIGRDVVQKMTQMFVYNKLMTELKAKGFSVLQEEIAQDDSVRIRVRRPVG